MQYRRLKLLVAIASSLLGRLHAQRRGAGDSGLAGTAPWVGIEGLEPRILFSAPAVGAELLAPPEIHGVHTTFAGAWDLSDSASLLGLDTVSSERALFDGADTAAADVRRELVFVDAGVADYQRLVDDLLESAGDGVHLVVVLLESDRDGIAQIGEVLGGLDDIDAVHIVSHGSDGTVKLGNTSLELDNLVSYAETISTWRGALSADADLLFYGCNLAAGEDGRYLVEALGRLTGADVAASTDLTGTARRGGDWDLEFSVGSIETAAAFSHQTLDGWAGLLATVTVTTTGDVNDGDTSSIAALIATPGTDGFISLREAIVAANNSAGADAINLLAGTYTLTGSPDENAGASGDLDISDAAGLTINGAGAASTIIDGGGIDRVFDVQSGGKVDIAGVTITNGFTYDLGGGINVDSGDVTLRGVIVSGSSAGSGAAVYSFQSTLRITDSEIVGNSTQFSGGGVYNHQGTAILERVTITGNTASKDGGGIYNVGSTLSLTNVTISGNSAAKGGGIFTNRSVSLTNSTVAFNSASNTGGGINTQGAQGDAVLQNTILAFNTGGNASKALTSLGNNIDSGNTAALVGPGDLINTDPLLGSLQDNGGPTRTHALLSGSLAIDAGANAGSPTTDQRGFARSDGATDIGAFEFSATPNQAPTTGGISDVTVGEDAADSVVDLFAAFADAEDADPALTYTIVTNTNPALFSATTIDGLAGTLTLAYAPDTPGTADITVRATDTAGLFVESTFTVTVNPVNDDPVLATGGILSLNEDATATITRLLLEVTDIDNTSAEIVYSLTATPTNGTLWLSGVALGASDTFTQADIDAGLLTYEHDGSETVADGFTFAVSDSSGGVIGATPFTISVSPVNDDPILTANSGLTVSDSSSAPITPAELQVTDADNTSTEITYTVTALPINGALKLSGSSLGLNDTFTQDDIDSGRLFYEHSSGGTTSDSFDFTVSDGAGGSIGTTTFSVAVNVGNVDPVLATNGGLGVSEAGSGTITNAELEVTDADNTPAELRYTLSAVPTNGTLRLGGTVLGTSDSFSQQDIDSGLLTYQHDGSQSTSDSFTFTVGDGAGGSIGLTVFSVAVSAVNDDPILATNAGLGVNEGGTATITNALLEVTDVDNTAAEITYTLTAPPANGTLRFGGVVLGASDSFTQQDIDSGLLTFEHDGSETTSDSFAFTVDDGAGGSIGPTVFSVVVSAVNDDPIVATNAGLSVNEGGTATITNALLEVTDVDNTASEITYTLTAPPANGTLRSGGVILSANDSFSQQDIDAGLLSYEHDGSSTTADLVNLTVSDGSGSVIGPVLLGVSVNSANSPPILAVNTGWELFDDQPVTITSGLLAVSDADNTPGELTYTLTGAPLRGELILNGAALQAGDTFTQADIDNELLAYDFDGRDTGDDAFVFTVSDGAGGSIGSTVFNITVRVPGPTDPEPSPAPEPPEPPDSGDPIDGGDDPIVDPDDDDDDEDSPDGDDDAVPPPDLTGSDPESELDPLAPDDPSPRTDDPLLTDPPPIFDDDNPDQPDSDGPVRLARVAHQSQMSSLTVMIESRQDRAMASEDLSFITNPNDLWDSLDMLEDQLQAAHREDQLTAGAAAFVGLSLSVGYLVWTLRAGYLLSSLLTFMPAWKSIDPLPILEYYDLDSNNNDDDNGNGEDQESLDSLIQQDVT